MTELLNTNERTFAASSGTFRWNGGTVSGGEYTATGLSVQKNLGRTASNSSLPSPNIAASNGNQYTFSVTVTTNTGFSSLSWLELYFWTGSTWVIGGAQTVLTGTGTYTVGPFSAPAGTSAVSVTIYAFDEFFENEQTLSIDNASIDEVVGSSPVTGTLALTDAIDTLASSGSPVVAGTLALTDTLDTLLATDVPVLFPGGTGTLLLDESDSALSLLSVSRLDLHLGDVTLNVATTSDLVLDGSHTSLFLTLEPA